MKTFKVIASSITYYKIEIEAETEDEAYQIAKYDADGSDFREIGLIGKSATFKRFKR